MVLLQPQNDGMPASVRTEQGTNVTNAEGKGVWAYSPGLSAHAAIGMNLRGLGLEADFNYLSAGAKGYQPNTPESTIQQLRETLRMNIIGLMANGKYTFHTGTGFSPFIGAGVGGAHIAVTDNASTAAEPPTMTGWGLAYQGIAGFGVDVAPRVELRLGYRFFGTPESKLEYTQSAGTRKLTITASPTIISHRFELSIAYKSWTDSADQPAQEQQ